MSNVSKLKVLQSEVVQKVIHKRQDINGLQLFHRLHEKVLTYPFKLTSNKFQKENKYSPAGAVYPQPRPEHLFPFVWGVKVQTR